jgi:hypothetical protein
MQQRAKTIKKTSTPELLIFSTISSAFDFTLFLVPLNRIRIPNNFLKNYEILGTYSFAVLETSFFIFFPQDIRTCFFLVIARLAIRLKNKKENKKLKTEIWKRLEVFFRKQVCLFMKIGLKTRAEPISNLSAQCCTVPMIYGSHPHVAIFLNLLHPTRCARIHSTHVSSAQNHLDKCIAMPLLPLYFLSSTL